MLYVIEFDSGNVAVDVQTENEAISSPEVMAKISRGEIVMNIQRNPKGRHKLDTLPCGCNRYIQRACGSETYTADRMSEPTCSGCGVAQ